MRAPSVKVASPQRTARRSGVRRWDLGIGAGEGRIDPLVAERLGARQHRRQAARSREVVAPGFLLPLARRQVKAQGSWLVSSRLGWVRLFVAALLCVVGVARPVAAHAQESSVRRGQEPVHVTTTGRRAEIVRIGERPDDFAADATAVVAPLVVEVVAHGPVVLLRPSRDTISTRDRARLGRARGPPIA
jgi:hypothetical protein